ncbi:phosphomannomutase [Pholiota molesta]|nr:phosphomannomutase [Pholiota molesta]
MISKDFADRPKHILCLFDVDGTLSLALLRALRKKVVIGFVGGSDLVKITEQLQTGQMNILDEWDYGFAENGLTAFKLVIIGFLGEERYKPLVNFILHYIADLDLPIKRGTFIEFRKGMVNVSPLAVTQREIPRLPSHLFHWGKISFDIFPNGWDKTFALGRVADENFEEIHFFGDKTYKGGNDYEIYADPRTIGHSVKNPEHTMQILKELFFKD